MGKRKFTDEELLALLKQGMTHDEAATRLGVGRSTVSERAGKIRDATICQTTLFQSAPATLLKDQLTASDILTGLSTQAMSLLDVVNNALENPNPDEKAKALTKLQKLVGIKGNILTGLVQLQENLRKQLETDLHIREKMYNIQQVAEFQRVILEELKKESPEFQRRIMRRLSSLKGMKQALSYGT